MHEFNRNFNLDDYSGEIPRIEGFRRPNEDLSEETLSTQYHEKHSGPKLGFR